MSKLSKLSFFTSCFIAPWACGFSAALSIGKYINTPHLQHLGTLICLLIVIGCFVFQMIADRIVARKSAAEWEKFNEGLKREWKDYKYFRVTDGDFITTKSQEQLDATVNKNTLDCLRHSNIEQANKELSDYFQKCEKEGAIKMTTELTNQEFVQAVNELAERFGLTVKTINNNNNVGQNDGEQNTFSYVNITMNTAREKEVI